MNIEAVVASRLARIRGEAPEMYELLKEFMLIWNSRDMLSDSKKAVDRRSSLWQRASRIVKNVERS